MIENKLPEAFEVALAEVARYSGWALHKFEYHGVEMRELRRWEGNSLRKLRAHLREDQKIELIIQKDNFSNLPKLRIWLHNNMPMFPYTAEIKWKETEVLDSTLSLDEYEVALLDLTNQSV